MNTGIYKKRVDFFKICGNPKLALALRGVDSAQANTALSFAVFRIRVSFHADPAPKNVHMDPDADPRR